VACIIFLLGRTVLRYVSESPFLLCAYQILETQRLREKKLPLFPFTGLFKSKGFMSHWLSA
jgi:hypothetical protein